MDIGRVLSSVLTIYVSYLAEPLKKPKYLFLHIVIWYLTLREVKAYSVLTGTPPDVNNYQSIKQSSYLVPQIVVAFPQRGWETPGRS